MHLGLADALSTPESDPKEEGLKKVLESEKAECVYIYTDCDLWWVQFTVFCRFKQFYDKLRDMKTEVEHVQHLLQKTKVKVQKDFEEWWKRSQSGSRRTVSPRAAWHTPPVPAHSQGDERHRLSRHQEAIAAQLSLQQHSSSSAGRSHSPASGARDGARMMRNLGQTDSNRSSDRKVGQTDSNRSSDGQTDSGYGNGTSRMAGKLGQTDTNLSSGDPRREHDGTAPQDAGPNATATSVAGGLSGSNEHIERAVRRGTQDYKSSWQPADSVSPPQAHSRTSPAVHPGAKQTSYDDRYLSKQRALFTDNYNDTDDRFVQLSTSLIATYVPRLSPLSEPICPPAQCSIMIRTFIGS